MPIVDNSIMHMDNCRLTIARHSIRKLWNFELINRDKFIKYKRQVAYVKFHAAYCIMQLYESSSINIIKVIRVHTFRVQSIIIFLV